MDNVVGFDGIFYGWVLFALFSESSRSIFPQWNTESGEVIMQHQQVCNHHFVVIYILYIEWWSLAPVFWISPVESFLCRGIVLIQHALSSLKVFNIAFISLSNSRYVFGYGQTLRRVIHSYGIIFSVWFHLILNLFQFTLMITHTEAVPDYAPWLVIVFQLILREWNQIYFFQLLFILDSQSTFMPFLLPSISEHVCTIWWYIDLRITRKSCSIWWTTSRKGTTLWISSIATVVSCSVNITTWYHEE